MAIISVSGKIGSGKDTVGKIIQYLTSGSQDIMPYEEYQTSQSKFRYDSNWQIKKFAYKLKQIVSILTSISVEDLEKQEVKSSILGDEWEVSYVNGYNPPKPNGMRNLTVREILQKVGTEAMRNVIHPNIWVNALMSEYVPILECTTEENKRLLSIWKNMNTRCNNSNYIKYHKYGGKGITICKEWQDFEIFKNWALSNGYTNTLTLDRKDTNGNYTPNNCRFVTTSLQAFNKNNYDGGTSNIKGVNLYVPTGKWQSQIQSKNIKKNLGYYDTEEIAKQVYLKEYNKILIELEKETKLLQRNNYPNWVITDTRFENELEAVKSKRGITIRVKRTYYTEDKKYIINTDNSNVHPSETALDNATFDYEIENNDSIQELIIKVKKILIKENII